MKHGTPSKYLAFLPDFFIQVAIVDVIGAILFVAGLALPAISNNLAWACVALIFVTFLSYWPYFLIVRKGYTPGHAIVGFPKP